MKLAAKKSKTTLKEIAEEGESIVSEALAKKRKHEADVLDTMDAGFFFSVVFRSRAERDAWLKEKGLRLRDDEYIFGSDLNL